MIYFKEKYIEQANHVLDLKSTKDDKKTAEDIKQICMIREEVEAALRITEQLLVKMHKLLENKQIEYVVTLSGEVQAY